ncbi:volume-regulated anion channel subunit LRRC8C-like [Nematostella vectensis]|uniref:volume-regulated anion channel subunit LRRC8C-like n=1 Tax=Nematostella vectensis TaxID=45351 RepID=UPI0020772C40|nr:volume-regulated anion channel subunit LRRC8C-like [Nematostella vectensis]
MPLFWAIYNFIRGLKDSIRHHWFVRHKPTITGSKASIHKAQQRNNQNNTNTEIIIKQFVLDICIIDNQAKITTICATEYSPLLCISSSTKMFPIEQLARFEASNSVYRLLKPWWDVLTDYLIAAMLVVAVLAGLMQASSGRLVCLPADCRPEINQSAQNVGYSTASLYNPNSTSTSKERKVLTNLQDRNQYDFVEAECNQRAIHWFTSYFPLIVFGEAILLLVVHNFWLKWPYTSGMFECFLKLLTECSNVSGTSLAIANSLWGTEVSDLAIKLVSFTKEGDIDFKQLFLRQTKEVGVSEQYGVESSSSPDPDEIKGLSESITKFKADFNSTRGITLRLLYAIRAFFQCLLTLAFIVVNACFHEQLKEQINCNTDHIIHEKYSRFTCYNVLSSYFSVTLCIYYILLVFCAVIFVNCAWTYTKFNRPFDFKKELMKHIQSPIQDSNPVRVSVEHSTRQDSRPDTKQQQAAPGGQFNQNLNIIRLAELHPATGDFAFILHLLNVCSSNKPHLMRIAIFSSSKNEKIIKELMLCIEWPKEELERRTTQSGRELDFIFSKGVPMSLFEMEQLKSLTLRGSDLTMRDFDCTNNWAKLKSLKSLSLIYCKLTSIPEGVFRLESLEKLDLNTNRLTSIPERITHLTTLTNLNLENNFISEVPEYVWQMECLKVLFLSSNSNLTLNKPEHQHNLTELHIDGNIRSRMNESTKHYFRRVLHNRVSLDPFFNVSEKFVPAGHEQTYNMKSKRKGLAMIFKAESSVKHNEHDLDYLFQAIGYEILSSEIDTIQTNESILSNLKEHHNSVILAVLSCSDGQDVFLSREEKVSVEALVRLMCEIPHLNGKPKVLLLIHNNITSCGLIHDKFKGIPPLNLEPKYKDVLIVYSDLYSKHIGLFIKEFVKVCSHYCCYEDLLTLLDRTKYELGRTNYQFITKIPFPDYMRSVVTKNTFTKKLFFFPVGFEDENDNN